MHLSVALGIPWLVENPLNSLLWQFNDFRKLLRHKYVDCVPVSTCTCGTHWRRDVMWGTHLLAVKDLALGRCTAGKHAVCPTTGVRHLPLARVSHTPSFPWKLAKAAARLIYNADVALIARNFDRLMGNGVASGT